jgi:Lipopolysaccharide kinase (Kdo/WaaP) family
VFAGRGPTYSVPLGNVRAVVRHARHGGALARLTGDVFFPPTRAPYELSVALQLRAAGVRTPEVLAYATYRVGPLLRRVDVVTREVAGAVDLATLLAGASGKDAWAAATVLVQELARVGAYHADLTVKNVLLTPAASGGLEAFALDVDRIVWRRPGDPAVARANIRRLDRSARKWGLR